MKNEKHTHPNQYDDARNGEPSFDAASLNNKTCHTLFTYAPKSNVIILMAHMHIHWPNIKNFLRNIMPCACIGNENAHGSLAKQISNFIVKPYNDHQMVAYWIWLMMASSTAFIIYKCPIKLVIIRVHWSLYYVYGIFASNLNKRLVTFGE